jgi:hypothetical protein
MTPYSSYYSARRGRGASSGNSGMGGMGHAGIFGDYHHRPGRHITIKFRLEGATFSGISVAEALEKARISQRNGYLMHDILPNINKNKNISLNVRVRLLPSPLVSLIRCD